MKIKDFRFDIRGVRSSKLKILSPGIDDFLRENRRFQTPKRACSCLIDDSINSNLRQETHPFHLPERANLHTQHDAINVNATVSSKEPSRNVDDPREGYPTSYLAPA